MSASVCATAASGSDHSGGATRKRSSVTERQQEKFPLLLSELLTAAFFPAD